MVNKSVIRFLKNYGVVVPCVVISACNVQKKNVQKNFKEEDWWEYVLENVTCAEGDKEKIIDLLSKIENCSDEYKKIITNMIFYRNNREGIVDFQYVTDMIVGVDTFRQGIR